MMESPAKNDLKCGAARRLPDPHREPGLRHQRLLRVDLGRLLRPTTDSERMAVGGSPNRVRHWCDLSMAPEDEES